MPTLPPTNLFGLTAEDSLTELRRRYYDLALLCHPDRGGTATDMRVVQRSYEAAKVALEHQAEGDAKRAHLEAQLEMVEDDDGVKDIPSFRAIFDEVHDHFNRDFHAAFEEARASKDDATSLVDDGLFAVDPFVSQGYGNYMIVREPSDGPLGEVPAAQLTYNASDVWEDITRETDTSHLPSFVPPLDDEHNDNEGSAAADHNNTDATSKTETSPITTLATRAHATTTNAWARDAFPTTWTRHTRIADFGTATAVPDAVPLTDYRRSFAPLGCGKPKTWLQSHLPSLREETWADIVAEGGNEEADVVAAGKGSDETDVMEVGESSNDGSEATAQVSPTLLPLPWTYTADGRGSTLTLRRRHRMGQGSSRPSSGTEWHVTFESYEDAEAAATNVRPRVVGGCNAMGEPAEASFLTQISEQLGRLWTAWIGGDKTEDELLPAVVQYLDKVEEPVEGKVKME